VVEGPDRAEAGPVRQRGTIPQPRPRDGRWIELDVELKGLVGRRAVSRHRIA
jgi:hypothetical protein